jgi:uncharacterized protein YdeI (YjbR/CyaY-like superfamily)
MAVELPVLGFADAEGFADWIAAQPEAPGLWLKLARKGAAVASLAKQDAIDVALCWGWIDGQLKPFDQSHWLIRFTPRRAASKWSEINRTRAEALIAGGQIRPRGQAEIDLARADGRWAAAYAPQSRAEVPDNLAAALANVPDAAAVFATLDSVNRYAVLYRIQTTKTPLARARKIARFIDDLAAGGLPYPKKP